MSVRSSYEIACVASKISGDALAVAKFNELTERVTEVREELLRLSSESQDVAAKSRQIDLPIYMQARIWDVWQRIKLAWDHLDDVVLLCNCPFEDACAVASPSDHVYSPFNPHEPSQ